MSFRLGSKGDEVREIQAKLSELGFEIDKIDGVFGPKTRKAVVAFQKSKGLEADGVVGAATLSALGLKLKLDKPEKERGQFNELLLMNPNYFGNLKMSKYKPVKKITANTAYEELMCVGYHPHLEQLEAVVHIKRSYGYKGGVCGDGSREYVRFYVDWKNDGHWQDVGMAQFTAYDIPGQKPLEYAVTLAIDPQTYFCFKENLPKVRAILSWNTPPPPDAPDHLQVWGNTLEARIQIDALRLFTFKELDKFDLPKFPDLLADIVDINQPISTIAPKALSIAELNELYKDQGVQPHRFAFDQIKKVLAKPALASSDALFAGEMLAELNINISEMLSAYLKTDGNTDFEELKCIGYDPVQKGLVGTLTIKRPCGYLGSLCKKGSSEFVAFWEWDEIESTWVHLGTTSVQAHDIASIPNQGLQYAVFLPVDFSHHRRPCTKGASLVNIRAILSWNHQPPAHNPHWIPKWGNREETCIHIQPGICMGADPRPYIDTIGDMDICDIDQATGLATGGGITTGYGAANESPFGGLVTITGFIINAPKYVMEGIQKPLKYKVYVRPYDPISPQPWQPLANEFKIKVLQQTSPLSLPQRKTITQKPDPVDGYYTYYEDIHGTAWRRVAQNVLAKWYTGSSMSGKWQIKMESKDHLNNIYSACMLICEDGTTRSSVILRLDNARPDPVTVTIKGVQHGGIGPVDIAAACGKFQVGDIIHGIYAVGEEHFKHLTLTVHPAGPAGGATVSPSVRSYSIVPTTGESGKWTLNTAGMKPCGYLIRLGSVDRTIVNSAVQIGWHRYAEVGFCLEPAAKKKEKK